jgi:hypothetical protein
MLVPKYRATAKRVVGVPGQQMTVKAPAGVFSAPARAEAAAWEDVSTKAAQWGQVSYTLHRNGVIAGAKSKNETAIDDMFSEAQRRPVNDPKYMEKGGILGWFDEQIRNYGKTVGSDIFDPLTRTQVQSNYAAHLADKRRTLSTFYAGRLTNEAAADIAAGTEEAITAAANALPPDWDGDTNTLPLNVISNINAINALQDTGAKTNVIDFTAAQKTKLTAQSRIALSAVNQRNLMARTADQVEELLTQVEDPNNYRWLKVADRDRLRKQLDNKKLRLLRDEQAQERADRAERARQLKADQTENQNILLLKAADGDLRVEDVRRVVESKPSSQGLTSAGTGALISLALKEGPADSDPVFKVDLYGDLIAVSASDLAPEAKASVIDGLLEKAHKTVRRGRDSLLTHSDYVAFAKYAKQIRRDERDGGEVARALRGVRAFAGETPLGNMSEDDVPRVLEATRVFWQAISTGSTAAEASELAINRVRVRRPKILFKPAYLPNNIAGIELPTNAKHWKAEHVQAAKVWAAANKGGANLDRVRYLELMAGIRAIEAYIQPLEDAQ